ncbi:hypothetical protein IE077_001981 [Cardiosporidium cionae]|uniref:Exocyst complex component Sec8 n=1 Tax=Cardiosporidium cionae TaxID=476202 RepID=A0ABQ7JBT8_9APIC|nr:hypothetical protein IE077_001981 [Cardiosporidium cionae]|eukprot:KAF8821481.1 hypothetical protein IE077_001981 [Cardiosporidium cionae]
MFIAQYFDRLEKEAASQLHADFNAHSVPSFSSVKRFLENWLPNRPSQQFLYDAGIFPDPTRWTITKPMLERFFATRLTKMPLVGGNEFGRNLFNLSDQLRVGRATYSAGALKILNALSASTSVERPFKAEIAQEFFVQVDTELKRIESQIDHFVQKPNTYDSAHFSAEFNPAENHNEIYSHIDESKLMDLSLIEPMQQHLGTLHASNTKINYTLLLINALQSYEKARESFSRENSSETLFHIFNTLMYSASFQTSARCLVCKHIIPLLHSVIQETSKKLSESLDKLGWGRVAFASGCVYSADHSNDINLENTLVNPLNTSGGEPVIVPEILQKLDFEKKTIHSLLSKLLIAQKLEASTEILSSCNFKIPESSHGHPPPPGSTVSSTFDIHQSDLQYLFKLPPTSGTFLLDSTIHSNSFIGFEILAKAIVDAFRYHFQSDESPLNRLDKPEWAFRYLLNQFQEHAVALSYIWDSIEEETEAVTTPLPTSFFENYSEHIERAVLVQFDPIEGLAAHCVTELQSFIQYRMEKLFQIPGSELNKEPKESNACDISNLQIVLPLESVSTIGFLNMLQHLMHLQKTWKVFHKSSSKHLFRSFEENFPVRTLQEGKKDAPHSLDFSNVKDKISQLHLLTENGHESMQDGHTQKVSAGTTKNAKNSKAILFWASRNDKKSKISSSPSHTLPIGLLDIWIDLDSRLLRQMIAKSIAKGELMARQDSRLQWEDALISFPMFSSNLIDWLEASVERLESLSNETARKMFSEGVIQMALEQFRELLRSEWNKLEDLIKEQWKVSLLFDNCSHVLMYLDSIYRYKSFIEENISSLQAIKTRMLKAFCVALMDHVERCIYRMQYQLHFLSEDVLSHLKELRGMIYAPSFDEILSVLENALQERLVLYLFKDLTLFPTEERLHYFIQNGQELLEAFNSLSFSENGQTYLPLFSSVNV